VSEHLKVGKLLHASCSAEDYGRIVAIGEDDNGQPCIDIQLFHPNDLVDCGDDEHSGSENPLTRLELSPGATLVLRAVHYKMYEQYPGMIMCNTPGNGCERCTKLFSLTDEPFSMNDGFVPPPWP